MQWQSKAGKVKVSVLLLLLISFQMSEVIINGHNRKDSVTYDFDLALIGYQIGIETTIISPSFVPEGDSVWWNVYTPVDATDIQVRIIGGNLTSLAWTSVKTTRSFKIGYFSGLGASNYELQVRYQKIGGSYSNVETSTIEVFDRKLPTLYIDSDAGLEGKQHVSGKIRINASDNHFDLDWINADINYRGSVSLAHFDKHNIAFETSKSVSLLGMRKDDDWILTGDWLDPTQIRTRLTYGIYQEVTSINNKVNYVDSRYVEVILNEDYIGTYVLSERIDRKLLNLKRWDDNDKYHSVIYKGSRSGATFSLGDVLYKFGWELKEPTDYPYWAPLKDVTEFIKYSSDEEFYSSIFSYIDKETSIYQYLLLMLNSDHDSLSGNYYLYANASSLRAPLILAPWDFDKTWGAQGGLTWDPDWRIEEGLWNFDNLKNRLYIRLFENDQYVIDMLNTYFSMRGTVWTDNFILELVDQLESEIREAGIRNIKTWPREIVEDVNHRIRYQEQQSISSPLDYDVEFSYLRQWIIQRLQLLDIAAMNSLQLLSDN